jgi:TetR/AcrR family transcriptional regulator, lmrAB and yxaGH operons repressor
VARDSKQRMIEGAAALLARDGLQATSFADVMKATGAPRGSIYHHFPDGKNQLVAAAVDFAGERLIQHFDVQPGAKPATVAEAFLEIWRGVLERSNAESGCSVVAVATASDSTDLTSAAARAFNSWRTRLAELFVDGGMEAVAAHQFAVVLVASSEGAVVLSRAEHSLEPFEIVARALIDSVRGMDATRAPFGH